jgi:hypothetical protein
MNVLLTMRSAAHWLPLALVLSGCGKPAFPAKLFTVEAASADCPVMLSRTKAPEGGRPIEGSSIIYGSVSQSSHLVGNTRITVTEQRHGHSEVSASEELASRMRRKDRWLQVESVLFTAEDFSTYGASIASRSLVIRGVAH